MSVARWQVSTSFLQLVVVDAVAVVAFFDPCAHVAVAARCPFCTSKDTHRVVTVGVVALFSGLELAVAAFAAIE